MHYNLSKLDLLEDFFCESLFPSERNEDHFLRYKKFINSRKNRDLPQDSYCEIHHIVPRSFCPRQWNEHQINKNNIIILSGKEHFMAHLILWRAFPNSSQMALALHFMRSKKKGGEERYFKLTSKQYERLRKEQANISREQRTGTKWMRKGEKRIQVQPKDVDILLNEGWILGFAETAWNKGIPHKDSTVEKMKAKKKLFYEENDSPLKGIPHTEEHNLKIAKGMQYFYENNESPIKDRPRANWVKKKLSDYWNNYYKNNDGVNKNKVKISKEGVDKLIYIEQLETWIEKGWQKGPTRIKCPICGKSYTKTGMSIHEKSCFS